MTFISAWNGEVSISRESILEGVLRGDGDIVIISSTLLEGIGNPVADVDVCVVTRRLPTMGELAANEQHTGVIYTGVILDDVGEHANVHQAVLKGPDLKKFNNPSAQIRVTYSHLDGFGTRRDVQYFLFDDVQTLLKTIASQNALTQTNLGQMNPPASLEDLRFFHRFSTGVIAGGAPLHEHLMEMIDLRLYCYHLYRTRHVPYTDFQDLIGAYLAKNWDMATQMARQFILLEAQGLLHLRGITNPNPKWITTFAQRMKSDSDIFGPLLTLLRASTETEAQSVSMVLGSLDLLDAIRVRCLEIADTDPSLPSAEDMLQLWTKYRSVFDRKHSHIMLGGEYQSKAVWKHAIPNREFIGLMQRGLDAFSLPD
ncbi:MULTISPECIES: hypothetical protein [unclassified Neorhizobium]|uniref:hypothetical protein n=1 Tax=unclassified Neorhizobium TaxID=2629175 RepID=UPI001FF622B3|nr:MULTISPECIES: hypothetical protein [unclassified Neorhizobium]MCJ9673272.1 hypothetical protein [Neorhizobium sp. SHOUNA12B]MCJ9748660.1 hypothetical protein [Neorhizobium sp. SHOUNA12A]